MGIFDWFKWYHKNFIKPKRTKKVQSVFLLKSYSELDNLEKERFNKIKNQINQEFKKNNIIETTKDLYMFLNGSRLGNVLLDGVKSGKWSDTPDYRSTLEKSEWEREFYTIQNKWINLQKNQYGESKRWTTILKK